MGIALWVLMGAAFALLAKPLMPGPNPAGIAGSLGLGIGAALLGGLVGTGFDGPFTIIDLGGALSATFAAMAVMFCYRAFAVSWSQ